MRLVREPPPGPLPRPPGANPTPYRLRLATIERTNTLIVRGNTDDLQLIDALIRQLDRLEIPAPPNEGGPPKSPRKKGGDQGA